MKETRTSGSYAGETTYAYDTLGQLTRVNDPVENATWVYTYDRGGNILNKKRYAYTTGTVGTVQQTITYTYDGTWKDKLATYNGITLTHDAGGNLTNDGSWTYGWQAGRELLNMTHANGTYVHYDYDHNGMRVRKTAAGVATNYTVNGDKVTHLIRGNDWMHFFYDGQGRPAIVNYNNATYHYLYNLQGDVIALIDASGNIVVEYKYDAWGKIIARTGSLVSTLGYLNPFRYRGYVYDEETGLYYLRSRYYNPEWGRFINADVVMGKQGVLLSHNLFAYCANAPVLFKDDYGYAMVCAFDDCGFGNSAASLTSISMSGGGGGVWNVYAYADSTHRRGGQSIEKEYLAVCEGISVFAKIAVTGYIAWKIGAVAGLLGQGIFDEAILQGFGAVIGRGMQVMTMASGAAISIGINEAIGTIVWNEESEPMTWMKLGREVAESFVPSVSGVVASRLKWSKKLTDRLEYWEGVFKEIIINAIYDD